MLKLRVMGTAGEACAFADALEATGHVLERSRPYPNRGESGYMRIYLDLDVSAPVGAEATSAQAANLGGASDEAPPCLSVGEEV